MSVWLAVVAASSVDLVVAVVDPGAVVGLVGCPDLDCREFVAESGPPDVLLVAGSDRSMVCT